MTRFTYGGLALVVVVCGAAVAEAGKMGPPPVVSLKTVDGSSLTGLIDREAQQHAELEGARLIRWEHIRSVAFPKDRREAVIALQEGEMLRGRIVSRVVPLTTVVGSLSVPWDEIAELSVDPQREVPAALTAEPAPRAAIRFEIALRDGSSVLGTPGAKAAKFHGSVGRVEVPWTRVRKVNFHEDRETSTLEFWNGDKLVGCVDWGACPLSSGLGEIRVSTVHTKSIALSLGGVDLVAEPYASVTGDRYFLGGVQSSRTRRIGGRWYPPTQFIDAHAGGRIEYLFDEPVSEFHAVAGMYESYCAKKGSVIFKLETDEGQVFASRLIRNSQQEEVYVRFPPTRKLVLITDPNGSNQEDWSVWLRPEAR